MTTDTTLTGELVELPQAAAANKEANALLDVAKAYTIDSPEMYELATDELRNIATAKARMTETRLSITRPMDAAKARVMDLFRAPLERLEEADRVLRGAALDWKRAEDARIAKERAEAERQERERLAELARQQREAEAAERKAREEADKAMAAGDTQAMTAALVAAEEASSQREAAEDAVELAEVAPVAAMVAAPVKAAGISGRVTWKAEVVDLGALVTAAANALAKGDDSLLAHLLPNTTSLGQVAKALKDKARIPGVRVYGEESLAVRRR